MKKTYNNQNKWYNKYKVLGIMLVLILSYLYINPPSPADASIRDRVVKLVGNEHSCTGEQITTDSGRSYILTAGHCKVLADINNKITVITEDGKKYTSSVIEEDTKSDLLLLQPVPGLEGLLVSHNSKRFQHVRTFTHGLGLKTYKTEGTIIEKRMVMIPVSEIRNEWELKECTSMEKNTVEMSMDDFGNMIGVCSLNIAELYTTAFVAPGSSGGPVLNDSGDIVGVVSASDNRGGVFGLIIDQQEVNQFLKNK